MQGFKRAMIEVIVGGSTTRDQIIWANQHLKKHENIAHKIKLGVRLSYEEARTWEMAQFWVSDILMQEFSLYVSLFLCFS